MPDEQTDYDTPDSLRRRRNWNNYQKRYTELLAGSLVIPGWENMNFRELAKALCPEYAEDLESDLGTKYGVGGKG